MNKVELIQNIQSAQAELETLLAGLTEGQLTRRPGPQADWSVKDLIAHLTYWQHDMVDTIGLALRGETPPSEDGDAANARVFIANRDRPLAEIMGEFRRSLERVSEQVGALSEDDINNPERFAFTDGKPLWDYIAGQTYDHYEEHFVNLRAWRATVEPPAQA